MKNSFASLVIILLIIQEAVCTQMGTCESCDCQQLSALVNASVEQAIVRLENILKEEIRSAMDTVNQTEGPGPDSPIVEDDVMIATKDDLVELENRLTSTVKTLLKPMQERMNYHVQLPYMNFAEVNPAESCKAIYDLYHDTPSGHYWVRTALGYPAYLYCNMNATCGNLTGGWARVAYLDMRNLSHQCPTGFRYLTRRSNPRRLCDIAGYGHCVATSFSVRGLRYSHVYGRVIAYQNGFPIASNYIHHLGYNSIEQPYMFGVSLTHGLNPRHHIWTFIGAPDETNSRPQLKCPCININMQQSSTRVPSFIGNDYFCGTSLSNKYYTYTKALYPSDPLWDGEGCGPTNACCSVPNLCGENSPPWFIKHLPSSTTDDIEMRLCRPYYDGSTPIEFVELFVQ